MLTEIERLDRKRLRILGVYVTSFASFVILSLIRFFFRAYGLNQQPIGVVVLIGLGITLVVMVACVTRQAFLAARTNKDPKLKAAFASEMLLHLDAQAWRAAYIGTAVTVLFFAIASSFYPVCDPLMIALTSIIVGAGVQRAAFFFKYRSL
jgi:hypothetical protein